MRINEQMYVPQAIRTNDEKEGNPTRVKINRESFKSKTEESDPFDLELRIEPSDIQRIIAQATESRLCGSNDNCTGCGCNTCCSSC